MEVVRNRSVTVFTFKDVLETNPWSKKMTIFENDTFSEIFYKISLAAPIHAKFWILVANMIPYHISASVWLYPSWFTRYITSNFQQVPCVAAHRPQIPDPWAPEMKVLYHKQVICHQNGLDIFTGSGDMAKYAFHQHFPEYGKNGKTNSFIFFESLLAIFHQIFINNDSLNISGCHLSSGAFKELQELPELPVPPEHFQVTLMHFKWIRSLPFAFRMSYEVS